MEEKKKKTGFFDTVARVVTGKTKEQRKADAIVDKMVREKQLGAYRKERLAQASAVGRARAKLETQQRIKLYPNLSRLD